MVIKCLKRGVSRNGDVGGKVGGELGGDRKG